MLRICQHCGDTFEGRPSKKTCSSHCKSTIRYKRVISVSGTIEQRNEAARQYNATPRGKYGAHRNSAKQRGIAFTLTFAEWYELWSPYLNRDDGIVYHMCRTGDKGGYELGNVHIDTALNNRLEALGLL